MISVAEALDSAFALTNVLGTECVPLRQAYGRVLAEDAIATRDQPPFRSSAMDGYALRAEEVVPGAVFDVIGASAAGKGFRGNVGPGQAVRIFTGAPVPQGADRVVIQEDVSFAKDQITLGDGLDPSFYIRPIGTDFAVGATVSAPRRLGGADVSLFAAMNIPEVVVYREPIVALIATGDELCMPGETPGPDQIISSNAFALEAIAQSENAKVRILPIARDNERSLRGIFELAKGADLIVTMGGASVGDHDIVAPVAREIGMQQSFYKVAMRPGKPLMAGRLGDALMLGLPGNPVSSIVCAHVFMRPVLRAMQGLPAIPLPRHRATLAHDIGPNGPREHYMRARIDKSGTISIAERQDSSLLSVLSEANALVVRGPNTAAQGAGAMVEYLPL